MYLSRGKLRIYKPSAVMHVYNVKHRYLAERYVHLHLGKGAAEGIGVGLYLVCAFGGKMLAVCQAVEHLRGKLAKAHHHPAVRSPYDISVYYVKGRFFHPRKLVGVLKYFVLEQKSGLLDGKSRDICLSGGVGSRTEGRYVRVLHGHDMHVLKFYAQCLGSHLGEGRVGALADLRLTKLELYGTILVEHHSAGACLKGYGPYGGIIPEYGHTDSPPYGAGLIFIFFQLLVPVYVFHALVDALVKAVKVILVFGKIVFKADLHHVFASELNGVNA